MTRTHVEQYATEAHFGFVFKLLFSYVCWSLRGPCTTRGQQRRVNPICSRHVPHHTFSNPMANVFLINNCCLGLFFDGEYFSHLLAWPNYKSPKDNYLCAGLWFWGSLARVSLVAGAGQSSPVQLAPPSKDQRTIVFCVSFVCDRDYVLEYFCWHTVLYDYDFCIGSNLVCGILWDTLVFGEASMLCETN